MDTQSELPAGFTRERLALIVQEIRAGTASAVDDYDPTLGDTPWSLGCVAYDRRKFRLARLAKQYEWLTIVSESPEFIFAVEGYPVKHFKGEPDEPPLKAFVRRPRELDAIQRVLPFLGEVESQPMLRLIIVTDDQHRLSEVYLFQLDADGGISSRWTLDVVDVSSLEFGTTPEPYDPGPVPVQPSASEEEQRNSGIDPGQAIAQQ